MHPPQHSGNQQGPAAYGGVFPSPNASAGGAQQPMMQQPMQGGYPLQQQAPYQQAQQPQYMPPGQGGQHAQQGPGQPGTYTGGPAPYPAPYPAAGAQPMQQPAAGMAPQPAGMQPLQQPQQQPGMAPQQPGMQAAQQAGMQGMQQAPIALPNPNMAPLKPRAPEMFKTGLYDCYSDCGVCCLGMWCTPCLYGDNHARIHNETCCAPSLMYGFLPCFTCIFASGTRRSVRTKYNLHETPCSDCCVHCWCSPCGVCQEARELKMRG